MPESRRQPAEPAERTASRAGPVVLVFVDGLGWGSPDPDFNPCQSYGGRLFRWPGADRGSAAGLFALPAGGHARPIDAVLGVPGIPQSATGQTTLLTGVNAQAACGKHLTGFPSEALRQLLLERSLLKTLTDRGLKAAFANVFRPRFFELPREVQLRLSATTVANLAAELPFFTLDDLRQRRSIYHDLTNQQLQARGFDLPRFSPAEAGGILAARSRRYDFVLFEYFQTDRAGHSRSREDCHAELRKLESFLLSLLGGLKLHGVDLVGAAGGPLVILTSDHGNLEDLSTKRHTLNPVPLLAWGAGAVEIVSGVRRLSEVTPAIVREFARRCGWSSGSE